MSYQWHDLECDLKYPLGFNNDTLSYLVRSLANPIMGTEDWLAYVKPDFFIIANPDNGGIQASGRCDSISEGKEVVEAILKTQYGITLKGINNVVS